MLSFFSYSIIVMGFNLLFGYTGLLTFGSALFVALGGYTAAFLTQHSIMYMEVILIASIVLSAFIATIIGILCVRYVAVYFALLSLAFAELFYSVLLKSYHITGGDQGMKVLRPHLLSFALSQSTQMEFLIGNYYYYALCLLAISIFIMWRITSSPLGLCLKAIRENPTKAKYLGINVIKYRLISFVIASIYGAVGGTLLAVISGHVDTSLAYWTHSGTIVFMVLLGGFHNFIGPIVGAFIYIFLLDTVMSMTTYWRIIFGVILALIVIVSPGGIISWVEMFKNQLKRLRGSA
ncbi:MAG: branched-chain amino acid ABC transporter permease [Bacteroidia bacterium]|nr:branched-chain amino acid ABC transporter permease [Bacteroidia bacterium]